MNKRCVLLSVLLTMLTIQAADEDPKEKLRNVPTEKKEILHVPKRKKHVKKKRKKRKLTQQKNEVAQVLQQLRQYSRDLEYDKKRYKKNPKLYGKIMHGKYSKEYYATELDALSEKQNKAHNMISEVTRAYAQSLLNQSQKMNKQLPNDKKVLSANNK